MAGASSPAGSVQDRIRLAARATVSGFIITFTRSLIEGLWTRSSEMACWDIIGKAVEHPV